MIADHRRDRLRLALITIVSGRHEHLRRQLAHVQTCADGPDHHLVLAMNDSEIATIAAPFPAATVIEMACETTALELSAARNRGARAALDAGADLLVFLDVDCIPGPDLFTRYRAACVTGHPDSLLYCGPVTYLSERQSVAGDVTQHTDPHPARPAPERGRIVVDDDLDLFWSLSFAVTASAWRRLPGFHEGYRGYGGEDTDFSMIARRRGFRIAWVGGADAYHQYHPVSDPPVEHIDDIMRNASLFHERWNCWPMRGWLDAFEAAGLATYDADSDCWQ
ncbi:glycosyltransferase family 2 protein [Gordonia sp. ABSL49_1]|uniref:glycosyltransferase family 2 protein n=1 Tax=Gordonia sp. ABSL49_1 TaxID=2920941 RepID=UPI001F0D88B2|nr:galactosyltransferase-related protein [Gordonia sp. ABSL49_1]MCH5641227.1 galactosyltransferase-related protein [Gordonia sp. ABSL49_1]